MSKAKEPKFAFTALAATPPPDSAYHTAGEWEALIAETARIQSGNPNEDLVTRYLDPVRIWARRNGKDS